MEGLRIGLDLCDDYCQVSLFDPETMDAEPFAFDEEGTQTLMPTVLCRDREEEVWYIGEDAYKMALTGKGILVDKLLKLTAREGTSTMRGRRYEAEELLEIYLNKLLMSVREKHEGQDIAHITVTLQELSADVMDVIVRVLMRLGIPREKISLVSHTESFVYYVLTQKKELWANQVVLFDLSENGLHYYELGVLRGRTPQLVRGEHQFLEEGFRLDILETKSGRKLADTILTNCAERLLDRKVVSSVFLTGKGFEKTDWAEEFLRTLCKKRRVFSGQGLFSKGAAFIALDADREESNYNMICVCEGRIPVTVTMEASLKGRDRQLILASAGACWYDSKATLELIRGTADALDLTVRRVDPAGIRKISIPLTALPDRPERMTRMEVTIAFQSEEQMMVRIRDMGFGDFYPSSGVEIKETVKV